MKDKINGLAIMLMGLILATSGLTWLAMIIGVIGLMMVLVS